MKSLRGLGTSLSGHLSPLAHWLLLFLVSLVALAWIGSPQFDMAHTILWLAFSAFGSIGGYGVIYETVISRPYMQSMRQTVRDSLEDSFALSALMPAGRSEARLHVKVSPAGEEIPEQLRNKLWHVAISKQFATRLGKKVRILRHNKELEVEDLLHGEATLFAWAFGVSETSWPTNVPPLRVEHLSIGAKDFTNRLQAVPAPADVQRFECESGLSPHEEVAVRIDISTYYWRAGAYRVDIGLYLPPADSVHLIADVREAGLRTVGLVGCRGLQTPLVFGPLGQGTVEARIKPQQDRQHISIIANATGHA